MHADFPGVVSIQPDKALITSASIIKMHPALISIESWYETLNHTQPAARSELSFLMAPRAPSPHSGASLFLFLIATEW